MANLKTESVHASYLKDLGYLIKELALEAKQAAESERSDFAVGYMAGFHRVVSLMQQQAAAFSIPLEETGLQGVDADRDLV